MKIEANEHVLIIRAENDFDVIVLNVWRKKHIRGFISTYEANKEKFGEDSKASGFLRIDFDVLGDGDK